MIQIKAEEIEKNILNLTEEHFSGLRVSVSSVSGASQWRKESVTIIESQEPMEDDGEENEGDVESDGTDRETEKPQDQSDQRTPRRLSTSVTEERSESGVQFLSVPCASITASSSAETLTDNTLTAPSTPTNLTVNRCLHTLNKTKYFRLRSMTLNQ